MVLTYKNYRLYFLASSKEIQPINLYHNAVFMIYLSKGKNVSFVAETE